MALAASILATAAMVGVGWNYQSRQRSARLAVTTRVVTRALADAERLRGQAQSSPSGDLTKWSEARAAAERARDLLAQGEADEALAVRVRDVLADLERDQAAARKRAAELERDRTLLARLETIRGNRSEHWDPKRTDADYAEAFREFGIDPDRLDPEEAGKQIARRSDPVELASYLDDWAVQRRKARDKAGEAAVATTAGDRQGRRPAPMAPGLAGSDRRQRPGGTPSSRRRLGRSWRPNPRRAWYCWPSD